MAVTISPLELLLDIDNPRFVILSKREQAEIRKYLVTYEDVCQLATDINSYGSLLPGERIVVLHEGDKYIVVEGNRRTCSLQMLLNRELIPDGFAHRIPHTSAVIIQNCSNIEVDVLPDRDSALELMTKRHIEGVKQWKPLAKKQFFAANFRDGHGQSIRDLSRITGIREGEIKQDIRDYKFFHSVYERYSAANPDFNREIVVLKTDPFWRIFKAKFSSPDNIIVAPKDFLCITYDDSFNTISSLPADLFDRITQLVFEKAIVEETITTRNVLSDVEGIAPLLHQVIDAKKHYDDVTPPVDKGSTQTLPKDEGREGRVHPRKETSPSSVGRSFAADESHVQNNSDVSRPGGPPPPSFFETISWRNKLEPANPDHKGLLISVNELHQMSTTNCGRNKAYKAFPISTGMLLRTAYEQALRLRLKQVNLWGTYLQTLKGKPLPNLKSMESFINSGTNRKRLFPETTTENAYNCVITATHREFLNANIHDPGGISVTAASLESIAAGGMFTLIQGIINMIN